MKSPNILGSFEHVSLPEFGLKDVLAKIDTGAYSGALHCDTIQIVQDEAGHKVLRFSLSNEPSHIFTTTDFVRRHVRSSSGHRTQRYIIQTTVVIQGNSYPISIGLSDRSKMKYTLLLGRRFLREHELIVDVRHNQEYDKDMEAEA